MTTLADLDSRTARILPWIVAVAFFMQTLDGTILNTALPAIAASLEESPLRMQSAVIAYMLTVAMLIPASGWLADRFGARRMFILAIGLFSFGSLLCALSQSLPQLVASRVLQAIGGSLMMPVGRLIILRNFPRAELVRIMSFVTIPGLMGPLIGPAVGGWLVEYASWHWIFLINLPVGALGVLVALRFLPDMRQAHAGRFDLLGFVLVAAAMLLLSLALEGVGGLQMAHAKVTLLLLAGLASMAAYWLHAARTPAPLFALSLFRIHSFSVGIVGNLFTRLGSGAIPFLTPLLLQVGMGFSPAEAGMAMIPIAVAAMAAKAAAARLLRWFGYRRLLTGNTLLLGLLVAGFGLLNNDISTLWLYAYMAVFGAVNSIQLTAMNTLTVIDLEGPTLSSGNSLVSVNMQLSMSLGIAMAAALLGGFVDLNHLGDAENVLAGFRWTYLCLGLATVLAAGIFLQLRADAGSVRVKPALDTSLNQPPPE